MSLKDLIKTSGLKLPPKTIIYGPPGTGKTSLVSNFPKVLFVSPVGENGVSPLIDNGVIPETAWLHAESWQKLREVTKELTKDNMGYKTFAVEAMLHKYVCDTQYDGQMNEKGFLSYMAGFRTSIPVLQEWLDDLDKLNATGVHIVLIGHSTSLIYKNPLGTDYGQVNMEMHDRTRGALDKWSNNIFYYDKLISTVKGKNDKQAKAAGDGQRIIYTSSNGSFGAKNRYNGLAPEILAGASHAEAYAALTSAIKATYSKG